MAKLPPKPKPGNKCSGVGVIYARYSSAGQKDLSIEQQVEQVMHLANTLGVTITDQYADRAVSGRTDKRPQFQQMMKDAAEHKFSYVMAWKSNRIGRNMLEALMNENKLNELGIRLLYVEEDFDDTAAGRFASRSMMNINQFFSENMAEDVVRGMRSNANNCLVNGSLPYGYIADKNLKYVIDEPKAEIVREIFTRVANGATFVEIMNDLNRRGIKTATGNSWNKSSFRLLRNERYRGVYIFDDIRIEEGIPRIVSDELFYKVQEVVKMKPTKGRHRVNGDYALTGKLYCGECGENMVGVSGTSSTGVIHYYYKCKSKIANKGCKKGNVRRDEIEQEVAAAVRKYVLQDDVMEWIADQIEKYQQKHTDNPEVELLNSRLNEVNASLNNIMAAIEKGIFTEAIKSRIEELEGEKLDLTTRLNIMKSTCKVVTREQIFGWLESFRTGDISDKQVQAELFNNFLTAVYLYDDKRVKILFSMGNADEQSIDLNISEKDNEDIDSCSCSYKVTSGVPIVLKNRSAKERFFNL